MASSAREIIWNVLKWEIYCKKYIYDWFCLNFLKCRISERICYVAWFKQKNKQTKTKNIQNKYKVYSNQIKQWQWSLMIGSIEPC